MSLDDSQLLNLAFGCTIVCLIYVVFCWAYGRKNSVSRVELVSEGSDRGPDVGGPHFERDRSLAHETSAQITTDSNLVSILISYRTPIHDIVDHLVRVGCKDITLELDLQKCSPYPFSNGGFGVVHKGALRSGQGVAIKCVEVLGSWESWELKEKSLKHAAHEIYVWSKSDHPAILPLLGFASFGGHILLISPWMKNGSLASYITRHLRCNRFRLGIELTSGLVYLHDKGIVHGDIKADNAVISDDGHVQLGDFGSATMLNYSSVSFTLTACKGTLRFMAPELLDGTSDKHTTKTDIYALGMAIFQIMTGILPYAKKPEPTIPNEVLVKKSIPDRPDFNGIIGDQAAKDELWGMLTRCWIHEPECRPTAMEVEKILLELERFSVAN